MNENDVRVAREKRVLEERLRDAQRENVEEHRKTAEFRAWGVPSSPDRIRELTEMTSTGRNLMRQEKKAG